MDRKKPTGVALALFIVSGLLRFEALVLLSMSLFILEFNRGRAPKLGNSSALLGASLLFLGFATQRKPPAYPKDIDADQHFSHEATFLLRHRTPPA